MRTLLLLLFLSYTLSLTAQATDFLRLSESDARKIATARGTFVIIDFYANWCGPCKTMDKRVWSQDTVRSLQSRFVNIRVDASTSNVGLLKYGIKAIPRSSSSTPTATAKLNRRNSLFLGGIGE